MILLSIILTIVVLFFEISFRDIKIFQYISLLFILVNLFYWFKQYRLAFVIGIIASLLIDLFLQNHLGRTLLALFVPLIFLTIVESFLKVENIISRALFGVAGCALSIFLSDFLFELLFWKGTLSFVYVTNQIIISGTLLVLIGFVFGSMLMPKADRRGY